MSGSSNTELLHGDRSASGAQHFGGLKQQYSQFAFFFFFLNPDLLKKSVTASNPS